MSVSRAQKIFEAQKEAEEGLIRQLHLYASAERALAHARHEPETDPDAMFAIAQRFRKEEAKVQECLQAVVQRIIDGFEISEESITGRTQPLPQDWGSVNFTERG